MKRSSRAVPPERLPLAGAESAPAADAPTLPVASRAAPSRRSPPMHALEAFEAAARLGTFAQAADELCVTHSAISHRIRMLEEHLGVPLFLRVHRQVLLTPAGERFVLGVREAMRELADAAASVGTLAGSRLRVTSSPALATHVLIPRLREFMVAHPRLRIDIDTSSRVADLVDGEHDLGLRFGSGPWPGLAHELLLSERVMALASPDYAAPFRGRAPHLALAQATLIHSRPFSWQHWLKSLGYPLPALASPGLSFAEAVPALDAAAHGLGVVLANRVTSAHLRDQGALVPFVPHVVDLRRHYYAVWSAASPRMDAIRAFLDWFGPIARAAGEPLPVALSRRG